MLSLKSINIQKLKLKSRLCVFSTLLIGIFSIPSFAQTISKTSITKSPEELKAEIVSLREQLKDLDINACVVPANSQTSTQLKAQKHFKIAENYRKLAQSNNASIEYLEALKQDPHLYAAYHGISLVCDDQKLLDDSIQKLEHLMQEKPKEMLLRVALSELFEKKGQYSQAARTLIDLTYANAVPEKYRDKVALRIHNLLAMSKSNHQKAETNLATNEEELDILPAPLPLPASKRSLAQAKIKDSKEVRGMGQVPLLP